MKITALLVLKCNPEGSDPVILANASDVNHFGYFQRSSVREFHRLRGPDRRQADTTLPAPIRSTRRSHSSSFSSEYGFGSRQGRIQKYVSGGAKIINTLKLDPLSTILLKENQAMNSQYYFGWTLACSMKLDWFGREPFLATSRDPASENSSSLRVRPFPSGHYVRRLHASPFKTKVPFLKLFIALLSLLVLVIIRPTQSDGGGRVGGCQKGGWEESVWSLPTVLVSYNLVKCMVAWRMNGLCAVGFMDDHYPVRSAFSLLNQVLDEYLKNFGDSWRAVQADNTQPWPYLNEALTRFQDPAEADKLLKIQRELDETKIILLSVEL
ncbi:SNARE-like superfamily protein [Actinidia rufa]|uniref:SNARE-like superfamily protein n=1 Tax=Actinidia rufa TaxID=165716 RepID=A0A7J0F5A2_9ERIC|nr:SNARE-like superfamily protein [Actinidia rufa]